VKKKIFERDATEGGEKSNQISLTQGIEVGNALNIAKQDPRSEKSRTRLLKNSYEGRNGVEGGRGRDRTNAIVGLLWRLRY